MTKKESLRDAFGQTLVQLGNVDERIVVLDADLATSTRVSMFGDAFPDRFIQVGIAEQNMIGVAAGLATLGYVPFISTFAVFASRRVCDQVAISVAYPRLNVKIVGGHSGLFTGKTGSTHQSFQDLAIMRSIANMAIVTPADAIEMRKAVKAIADYEGPVYLRLPRERFPVVFGNDYEFRLGQAVTMRRGTDLSIISTGIMLTKALDAADKLASEGISARVVNMSTIKPLDEQAIISCAEETKAIVTVENHSILGGLGGAVSELVTMICPVPVVRVGIGDTFAESGPDDELAIKYGLTAMKIVEASRNAVNLKVH